MKATVENIISILENAGISADLKTIQGDTKLSKDAGIDSLEIMSVFLGIEEKYGIRIPDQDVDQLETINDIIRYLEDLAHKTDCMDH
ncbi:MAG: acyl carrier protein [Methylococcaceae bacterium]|nr:acyl carrier protein [Methylococcaceae bacterium]